MERLSFILISVLVFLISLPVVLSNDARRIPVRHLEDVPVHDGKDFAILERIVVHRDRWKSTSSDEGHGRGLQDPCGKILRTNKGCVTILESSQTQKGQQEGPQSDSGQKGGLHFPQNKAKRSQILADRHRALRTLQTQSQISVEPLDSVGKLHLSNNMSQYPIVTSKTRKNQHGIVLHNVRTPQLIDDDSLNHSYRNELAKSSIASDSIWTAEPMEDISLRHKKTRGQKINLVKRALTSGMDSSSNQLVRVKSPRKLSAMELYHISLVELLVHVVKTEMEDCDIVITMEKGFGDPTILQSLLVLPYTKQIIYIERPEDFHSITWASNKCKGYVMISPNTTSLLTFANQDLDAWDYDGRYVFANMTEESLRELVASQKGKKTENIVGVVQSRVPGEWKIYMNRMFWGRGIERINMWKNKRFTSQTSLYPDKLIDLRGAQLKVTTFKWEPEVMYYKDDAGNLLYLYGIDIEVVNTLKKSLNFTVKYQEPPKGELWGSQLENGSWSGMMGMISKDEADMCFPLYVSYSRLGILDYTSPYKLQKSCFVVKTEPPLPNWQALSYPFNPWTWLSILIGLLISGPVLYILASGTKKFGEEIGALKSLVGSCHYTLGLHFIEPQQFLPKQPTTQIYILFLWLYCFILTIAYSTNLTAFLTVKKAPARMQTIKDLQESGMFVSAASGFYKDMFIASNDESLQELAQRYEVLSDQEEIFRRIAEGHSSYPENEGYLEFIIHTKFTKRGLPQARILKECYALHSAAMALQNHSPLKRRFDTVVDGMVSGGLIRRYLIKTLEIAKTTKEYGTTQTAEEGEDEESSGGNLVPLSLDHLQGIFFIIIVGWILSVLAFMAETFAWNK